MEGGGGPGDNPAIWREVNRLARRIKELDPNHPVMTVVANICPEKLAAIAEHAPDVDILGINAYAGVAGIAGRLRKEGWTRPYCISEFGLPGPWEVEHTAWNAPLEPSSLEKATATADAQAAIMEDAPLCVGSYAFLWGQKQEATSSWFSMFLQTGEKTPRVDAMARAWTGRWPENRAPVLDEVAVPFRNTTVRCGIPSPPAPGIAIRRGIRSSTAGRFSKRAAIAARGVTPSGARMPWRTPSPAPDRTAPSRSAHRPSREPTACS